MKPGSLRALALVLAVAAPAAASAADIRPMIKLGLDTGGDTIITHVFPNGEVETIDGNQGFYAGGGVSITNFYRGLDLELEASLTFKYANAHGDNGKVSWTRYPLDVLAFYRWSRFRAGGGITYHFGPKLKGDGDASGLNVKFENAFGFVLQADYRVTENFTAGLRYTAIEYETKATPAVTTKSSGIGLTFGFAF